MADPETRLCLYVYKQIAVTIASGNAPDVFLFEMRPDDYGNQPIAFRNGDTVTLPAKVYGIQCKGAVRITPTVLSGPDDLIVVYDVGRKDPWPKPPKPPKFYETHPSAKPWDDHAGIFMMPGGFGDPDVDAARGSS